MPEQKLVDRVEVEHVRCVVIGASVLKSRRSVVEQGREVRLPCARVRNVRERLLEGVVCLEVQTRREAATEFYLQRVVAVHRKVIEQVNCARVRVWQEANRAGQTVGDVGRRKVRRNARLDQSHYRRVRQQPAACQKREDGERIFLMK